MPSEPSPLPVAVIGGGPIGLAATAHLLERGIEAVVFEAGPTVGTAPLGWGHVPMFSPWRYNFDMACRTLLERSGDTTRRSHSFCQNGGRPLAIKESLKLAYVVIGTLPGPTRQA